MQQPIVRKAEKLLIENYEKYYRVAYNYVKSEEDALDVVQESACKVIQNCGSVRNENHLETWIYRVVLNAALDLIRKRVACVPVDPQEDILEAYTEDVYEDMDLQTALALLDQNEQTIVVLRFFEDRRLDEIAQIMDVGVNTIKSRLYRALRKLKITLEEA